MRLIANHLLAQIEKKLVHVSCERNGLMGGKIGIAYYLYHSFLINGFERSRIQARELLQEVVNSLPDQWEEIEPSFAEGLAGIAYVLHCLQASDFSPVYPEAKLQGVDRYLFEVAMEQIEGGEIDFLYGASGILHYFLEKSHQSPIEDYLHSMVQKMADHALIYPDTSYLYPNIYSNKGSQYLDFGLSHGVCGVLLVLLQAQEKGIQKELIEPLVSGGLNLMIDFRGHVSTEENLYSFFPFFLDKESSKPYFGNRLGWCYGDLNQALLLYRSSQLFQREEYRKLGDLVGTHTLLRKEKESTEIEHMHFCHGSAGLATFYQTLYELSGIETYHEGYEYWIEQTLIHLCDQSDDLLQEPGLLEGLIGIAFTLLSYLSHQRLDWPKTFLL